ncbi:pitrilysin family protein [Povalibacter sp.]|uniref:M16 family metallopeptidase n=1 Tax=Povalibacter sp. TaxID=1962978 RepID=UPI002F3E9739
MNRLQCVFVGALAALATHPVMAQDAPPRPGPPRAFQLPTPTTLALPNGLKATFVDFGVVPKATISITVRTGNLNEGEQTWLADLAADLLKEGTNQRTAQQIADAATLMGGGVSIGAGPDQTYLQLDVLGEYVPDAIALLAEILTQPKLPENQLARIRQDYSRNLSVALTQPQALAGAAMAALLYPDHPYGRVFPTQEQLQGYSIGDVRKYYDGNFGARRTQVYVAGKFDRAKAEQAIRTSLGSWREGPAPLELAPASPGPRQVKLIDRPDAPQSTLRIGKRVVDMRHPDFMALSVTNSLLGGVLMSRITMNLREDKGWAYSPNSGLETKYHEVTWIENADVKSASTGPSVAEVFKEIELLRVESPTDPELTAIKNYRNGVFVMSTATRGGLIGQLMQIDLQGLPPDWLTTFPQRMYAVTPAQVTKAARDHLDPAAMSVVVVGDLKTVRPQLDAIPSLRDAPARQTDK